MTTQPTDKPLSPRSTGGKVTAVKSAEEQLEPTAGVKAWARWRKAENARLEQEARRRAREARK